MRIEAYTQVQQLYNTSKAKKNNQVGTAKFSDQFEMSKIGKDMQIAKNAVSDTPDVRKELVAPIKEQIQNGTYDVSGDSFAEKVIQKYEESQIF